MTSKCNNRPKINIFFIMVVLSAIHQSHLVDVGSLDNSRNIFATKITQQLVLENPDKNVIFSPASIQSCLALAFFGASGETAKQMSEVLSFGDVKRKHIAANYREFLKNNFNTETNGSFTLKMANKIYVSETLKIKRRFNKVAKRDFNSEVKPVNFNDPTTVSNQINSWVSQETNNKINNLLQPNNIENQTKSILINAIYLKANWLNPFFKEDTKKQFFFQDRNTTQLVDIMHAIQSLNFVYLPEFNASALELPYGDSNVTMLILLPIRIEGLNALESRLSNIDLNEITSKMENQMVQVILPKFKIEFDVDLKESLIKLGLTDVFSEKANFAKLFKRDKDNVINKIKHKAYLEVNEDGSEASAATATSLVLTSGGNPQVLFRADHPFIFFIRNSKAVFFAGHVKKIE